MLRKYWPLILLLIAALFWFWGGDEKPAPKQQGSQQPPERAPFIPPAPPQTSPQGSGGRPGQNTFTPLQTPGVAPYGSYRAPEAPAAGKYHFRPLEPKQNRSELSRDQDAFYLMPKPEVQEYPAPGIAPNPGETSHYRFRPKEKPRQPARRQPDSYYPYQTAPYPPAPLTPLAPQPYPYGGYYPPLP